MTIGIDLSWLLYPIVALAAYWPCLTGEPIFDDQDVLHGVQRGVWNWEKIRYSRPLTSLSFALTAIWPNTLRSFHVFNVLAHSATGVVVRYLASQLGLDPVASTLAGFLFVAHPFATNTVGYITARSSILSSLFGLLAVFFALTAVPILAIPCLAMAVASKEDGVGFILPVAAVLAFHYHWYTFILLILTTITGLLIFKKRLREFRAGTGDSVMLMIGLPVSYRQPVHALTVATETLLRIPSWMVGFWRSPYPGSGVSVPSGFRVLRAALVLVAALLLSRFFPVPLTLVLLGPWLVYLAVPVPDQLMEYRNYSQTAGFALLFASLLQPSLFLLPLILGALILTFKSAAAWQGPIPMWLKASKNPSGDASRIDGELGAYFKLKDDKKTAEMHLRKAIDRNPGFGPALNNLAWICADTGRLPEAVRLMEICAGRCPQYALGWQDLGLFYERTGRLEDADRCYRQCLFIDPRMELPLNRLGMTAFAARRFGEALETFDALLERRPGHFEYVYNRAVTLKYRGNLEEAAKELERLPKPCPFTPNMLPLEYAQ